MTMSNRNFVIKSLMSILIITTTISAWANSGKRPAVGEANRTQAAGTVQHNLFQGHAQQEYRSPIELTNRTMAADVSELRKASIELEDYKKRHAEINKGTAKTQQEMNTKIADVKKIEREMAPLAQRISRLQANYDQHLNKLKEQINKSDADVLKNIQERMKGEKSITIDTSDVANIVARFAMLDLQSDVRDFLRDTDNVERDLQVLQMKLDQSLLGTYVQGKNRQLLDSQDFCTAVQAATKAEASCIAKPALPTLDLGDGGSRMMKSGTAPTPAGAH